MKSAYDKLETIFDRFVNLALKIYGSAVTFLVAVIAVIVFLTDRVFYHQNLHDVIRDIIMCVTFLSFFIIQKAFNKYTAATHLKINELVSAHERASNDLINVEDRTEAELKSLAKKHTAKNHSSEPGNSSE